MNADKKLLNAMGGYFKLFPDIDKVVLFGSRARGDNAERSDYDIAVYGKLAAFDKVKIRSYIDEELPTLHKIDLIFMADQTNSEFISNIENEGVKIYEKS